MIKLSKSSIGSEEKEAVLRVLDNEYLGMGPKVEEFEQGLTKFFGRKSTAVVNGTAALQLALEACKFKKGSEVLVPSLTYVASFQAISAAGLVPVACDIEEEHFLLDIGDAKKRISEKTVAIMPVHYTGGVGEIDKLYEFANFYKLRVIEDAAHAFGSKHDGRRIGSFGDIVCFSFDGIKNITSGEGGCVVTSDEQVTKYVQDARLLGVVKDTQNRYGNKRSWDFEVDMQGWRYHMSNLMAAIGVEQLKKSERIFKTRQKIANLYDSLLKDFPGVTILKRDYKNIVPHIYVIKVEGLNDRGALQSSFLDKGIEVGYHYKPNHHLGFFSKQKLKLPITDEVHKELITLPLHCDLSESDVKNICEVLKSLI